LASLGFEYISCSRDLGDHDGVDVPGVRTSSKASLDLNTSLPDRSTDILNPIL
jgi:hypothetical protein